MRCPVQLISSLMSWRPNTDIHVFSSEGAQGSRGQLTHDVRDGGQGYLLSPIIQRL